MEAFEAKRSLVLLPASLCCIFSLCLLLVACILARSSSSRCSPLPMALYSSLLAALKLFLAGAVAAAAIWFTAPDPQEADLNTVEGIASWAALAQEAFWSLLPFPIFFGLCSLSSEEIKGRDACFAAIASLALFALALAFALPFARDPMAAIMGHPVRHVKSSCQECDIIGVTDLINATTGVACYKWCRAVFNYAPVGVSGMMGLPACIKVMTWRNFCAAGLPRWLKIALPPLAGVLYGLRSLGSFVGFWARPGSVYAHIGDDGDASATPAAESADARCKFVLSEGEAPVGSPSLEKFREDGRFSHPGGFMEKLCKRYSLNDLDAERLRLKVASASAAIEPAQDLNSICSLLFAAKPFYAGLLAFAVFAPNAGDLLQAQNTAELARSLERGFATREIYVHQRREGTYEGTMSIIVSMWALVRTPEMSYLTAGNLAFGILLALALSLPTAAKAGELLAKPQPCKFDNYYEVVQEEKKVNSWAVLRRPVGFLAISPCWAFVLTSPGFAGTFLACVFAVLPLGCLGKALGLKKLDTFMWAWQQAWWASLVGLRDARDLFIAGYPFSCLRSRLDWWLDQDGANIARFSRHVALLSFWVLLWADFGLNVGRGKAVTWGSLDPDREQYHMLQFPEGLNTLVKGERLWDSITQNQQLLRQFLVLACGFFAEVALLVGDFWHPAGGWHEVEAVLGRYEILREVKVTEGADPEVVQESVQEPQELAAGTEVDIIEVQSKQDLVRGRLRDGGWISIRDTREAEFGRFAQRLLHPAADTGFEERSSVVPP
ncbi:Pol [Symbiodinium natans]|uniref:Pol protein n=1 Tax=Symbiodinium natans TaxID=878477 RepID=A0A812SMR4_9DINO|nr:Pol [Symbiodinium natans]